MKANDSTKVMVGFATGLVALAITSAVGIAVLAGFINASVLDANGEAVLNNFITGIAVFGTFATILALVVVGKIVLKMVKS